MIDVHVMSHPSCHRVTLMSDKMTESSVKGIYSAQLKRNDQSIEHPAIMKTALMTNELLIPCPRRAGDAGVARKAISLSAGLSAKMVMLLTG